MKSYLGMIAAALALTCPAIHARAEEIPVEKEFIRAVKNPCQTNLELFIIGDNSYLSCPGCTVWELNAEDEIRVDDLGESLAHEVPQYDLLRFMQLAMAVEEIAALRETFSIFAPRKETGGVSFAATAKEKGMCKGEPNRAQRGECPSAPQSATGPEAEAYRQWLIKELERLADQERAEWNAAREKG